ncbi:hypothetical protein GCM10027610_081060 [Dactylosporangium cerinum]
MEDRATSLLMGRFYQHHLCEQMAPAAALRLAQLWLRDVTAQEAGVADSQQDHPFADPYYWAAFQFTGA